MEASKPNANEMAVEVRELPEQQYLGKRQRVPMANVGGFVQSAFNEIFQALAVSHNNPAGSPFLIAAQPEGGEIELEIGVPCAIPAPVSDDLHPGQLPAGKAAVYVYKGPYDGIGPYYTRLASWIESSGHHFRGAPREVYLTDPNVTPDPNQHVTELVWPID